VELEGGLTIVLKDKVQKSVKVKQDSQLGRGGLNIDDDERGLNGGLRLKVTGSGNHARVATQSARPDEKNHSPRILIISVVFPSSSPHNADKHAKLLVVPLFNLPYSLMLNFFIFIAPLLG
jgi:hypothetical protein